MSDDTEWLESLKPSDTVVVDPGTMYGSKIMGRVARITKRHIILDDGSRFTKSWGHAVGEVGWFKTRIEPATESAAAEIERDRLIRIVDGICASSLTDDQLFRIAEIVKPTTEGEHGTVSQT